MTYPPPVSKKERRVLEIIGRGHPYRTMNLRWRNATATCVNALEWAEIQIAAELDDSEFGDCIAHLGAGGLVDSARELPGMFARLRGAKERYFFFITPQGRRFLAETPIDAPPDAPVLPLRAEPDIDDAVRIYRERETEVSALIAVAFDSLRTRAPGAAYLFARTLVNARPLLDDLTIPNTKKIKIVQDEIDESTKLNTGDASLGVNTSTALPFLALKFVLRLLEVAKRDVVASFRYSAAFDEIAKAGEHYRELEPRDRQPPHDAGSRAILAEQAHTCVGEVVDAVIADYEKMDYDRGRAAEDIATLLASFDLREEAASGRLSAELRALETAINTPC